MIETIAVSVVPTSGAFAPQGQLESLNFGRILEGIRSTVASLGLVEWAALGLDISFNDMAAKGLADGWQVQAYGIAKTTNRRKFRDELNKAFPKTPMVPRPIRTKRYDGSARGASYAFKYQFIRRVSYLSKNGRWNTRKVSLKRDEHIELMLVLDGLGLAGRVASIDFDLLSASGRRSTTA